MYIITYEGVLSIILPYSRAAVHVVDQHTVNVPGNIVVRVDNASVADKIGGCLTCFADEANVNTAIILDQAAGGMDGIGGMDIFRDDPTAIITFSDLNSEEAIATRLQNYFQSRAHSKMGKKAGSVHFMARQDDIAQLAGFVANDVRRITASGRVKIAAARLSFTDHYFSKQMDGEGWLTPHVDQIGKTNFDARLVHTVEGLATITFDDHDFVIYAEEQRGQLEVAFTGEDKVLSAFSGPQGSYTLMRSSEENVFEQGSLPAVHSHGLTRTGDLRRLTVRYDLVFK